MGDHRLHRLALGERRAGLFQSRRRQARSGSDRPGERRRELRLRACGPLSDRRADHGARTLVPSSRDERHRSGDLRRRVGALLVRWHDMSAQKTGKNGPSLAVPPEEEEEAAAAGIRRRGRKRLRRCGSRAGAAGRPARKGSICRGGRRRGAGIGVLRRGRDPDSVAGAAGARKPYFIFGDAQNSVDLWFFDLARPDPAAVHRQRQRGHRAQRRAM